MYKERFRKLLVFTLIFFIISNIFNGPINSDPVSSKRQLEWSYFGKTGPRYWGLLDPTFIQCTIGSMQSPINIRTAKAIQTSGLEDISFKYTPTIFSVKNSGRTIEVVPYNEKNSVTIGTTQYHLQQIHFHHPSEHQLDNRRFPVEVHLVHQDSTGRLTVIGIWVKAGDTNNIISKILENVPKTDSKIHRIEKTIDIANLLPKQKDFFKYKGSLTTPPCTEGVEWLIFKHPIEMSKRQINKITELFPENSRPLQPINEREVYLQK
ncbi:carbonic anhydrase family protein [Aquibacillus halophilus]|uniref:Carbonic anhydrase n=1 Tax=Aquibacillus halophilus TaxID=930132 RepID=A0A6A8DLG7_9BACI|nr:carbonic anhydrase family protein [Aquibacillus halophilus]MRH43837.1 carbonic anhydrase family protein [Aquibacillus halophilus]